MFAELAHGTADLVLIGIQLLYLSRLGADSSFWDLVPGFVVGGFGCRNAYQRYFQFAAFLDEGTQLKSGLAERARLHGRTVA